MKDKQLFLAKYGSAEHVNKLLDTAASLHVRMEAAKNPSIEQSKIDHLIDHSDDWYIHLGLSKNPSLTTDHIKKLANHKGDEIQTSALMHPKATKEMVHAKINDENTPSETKENLLIYSPHIDDELCKKVMKNRDEWAGVKRYAERRLKNGIEKYEGFE